MSEDGEIVVRTNGNAHVPLADFTFYLRRLVPCPGFCLFGKANNSSSSKSGSSSSGTSGSKNNTLESSKSSTSSSNGDTLTSGKDSNNVRSSA